MKILVIGSDVRARRSLVLALRRQGASVVESTVTTSVATPFDAIVSADKPNTPTRALPQTCGARLFRYSRDKETGTLAATTDSAREAASQIVRTIRALSRARMEQALSMPRAVRIFLLDACHRSRHALVRALERGAAERDIKVEIVAACGFREAVTILERDVAFDLLLLDACLGGRADRSGLGVLELARERGNESPAFIVTAARDYRIDVCAEMLRARYVPKDGIDLVNLVSRVLATQSAPSECRDSASVNDAARFLAEAPGGLRQGILIARRSAVHLVVNANGGNRTLAARKLKMTRQQVQEVLREESADVDSHQHQ